MKKDLALNGFIEHTLLRPECRPADIETLCAEAAKYQFHAVCVMSAYVPDCVRHLTGTRVAVASVVGFPIGSVATTVKAFEAEKAFKLGAKEVDMVIPVGHLKAGLNNFVLEDIKAVVSTTPKDGLVKVIIETALLTEEEKHRACKIAEQAGAHFVKTCTGFFGGAASVSDVSLMRSSISPSMGVKASGGIRSAAQAIELIRAGATRLGTSAGVAIITNKTSVESY
ncbi:MAG: deoxyribose-phosphate aldolase [Bdellovibrionaceae bacterium]|nr:deoxyribose-phosphate aldolase [Pseudobdellovibrionaceae bacterium]